MKKRLLSLLLASVLALSPVYANVYAEEIETLGQETGVVEEVSETIVPEGVPGTAASEETPETTVPEEMAATDAGMEGTETSASEDLPVSTDPEDVDENIAAEDASESETIGDTAPINVSEVKENEDLPEASTAEDKSEQEQTAVTEVKEGNNSAESIEDESKKEETPAETLLPDDPDATSGTEEVKTETANLDLDDEVLQFGGFPRDAEGRRIARSGEASLDGLADELADAIENLEPSVDVEKYSLTLQETGKEVAGVLNANPTFFTVESIDADYNSQTGKVSEVKFSYLAGASDMTQKYENQVTKILSGIKNSWTDFQKLLYLHDYLVTHNKYDFTYSKYSAYNAIVEHTSVCQGYAEAYEDLANRAGIDTYIVTSNAINHAWNLVALGGKKYFVDCTWDDPGLPFAMSCWHTEFLCSQTLMAKSGHSGSDWQMVKMKDYYSGIYESAYGKYDNKKYDASPWRSSFSSFVCMNNGKDIFAATDTNVDGFQYDQGIHEYDEGSGSARKLSDAVRIYEGSTLTGVSGKVYVNDEKNIYRLDTSNGGVSFVYGLSSSEKSKGTIYGIEGEGNRIRYDIATGSNEDDFVRSGYADVNSGSNGTSIKLDKTSYAFGEAGETMQLTATLVPAGSASVIWGSSNDSVATVKNGLVTATGNGEATIYATAGDKSATCLVTVGTVVRLNRTRLEMHPGETATLVATVVSVGTDDYEDSIHWYSSDNSIVSVSDTGVIIARNKGEAYVYAYTGWSGNAYCRVTVSDFTPPVISSMQVKSNGITVGWNAVPGATSYDLQSKEGSGSWTKVANVTGTSYKDKSVTSGRSYSYRVRARNDQSKSKYSRASDAAVFLSQPAISSVKNNGSRLTVKIKSVAGATGYIFQRRINGGSWGVVSDQTGTTLKDKSANKNGRKYEYRVYAYKKSGGKTYKSIASVVSGMYFITQPSITKLTTKSKSMTVKWDKNGSANGYQIEYSRKKDFSDSAKIKVSGKTHTSQKISKLKKGKTYYVRMRTYKMDGNNKIYSAWSDAKKIKIK